MLDVNVIGTARVSRAAWPYLGVESGTRSSTRPRSRRRPACPSGPCTQPARERCLALTRAMAADGVAEGIRVNAVNPGTADTPWVGRLLGRGADPDAERRRAGGPPAPRPAGLGRRGRRRGALLGLTPVRVYNGRRTRGRRRDVGPAAQAAGLRPRDRGGPAGCAFNSPTAKASWRWKCRPTRMSSALAMVAQPKIRSPSSGEPCALQSVGPHSAAGATRESGRHLGVRRHAPPAAGADAASHPGGVGRDHRAR